jgi:hypothetical protein
MGNAFITSQLFTGLGGITQAGHDLRTQSGNGRSEIDQLATGPA